MTPIGEQEVFDITVSELNHYITASGIVNRNSWIGFDESTHRREFQIRYLLSRLRSTDATLFRRARFATNPGGPGHAFHQHVFLGGVCPHCEPPVRQPSVIYKDATWLTDKKPIGMSTQFIFGRWDPKGLLPDYDRQLKMQQGGIAKALLEGCWRSFEGQYYDIWEPNRAGAPMVVKRQTIGEQYWWPFWVGVDYGFSGSSAAAYLFTRGPAEMPRWPNGRIYCIQEYVSHREDVRSFARSVYQLFARKKDDEVQARRVLAMYLSPDSWNDRGDLHTLAGQMNEVLEPHGLSFEKADNDRAGGAQLIYTMLQSGELVIADCCVKLVRSIESRVHDKKDPAKVAQVVSDELGDAYDGFRYGVYSYQREARKPTDLRIQERVDRLYKTDPTLAMMMADSIRKEERQQDQSQSYGSNVRRMLQELEKNARNR